MADGSTVLKQDEKLVFRAAKDLRIIDRIVTLTAQDKPAVFHDSKEGVIAIRVTRSLEEPLAHQPFNAKSQQLIFPALALPEPQYILVP
jgi:hypothetical protein